MRLVVNDYLPLKGFALMAVFPFVFVRREYYLRGLVTQEDIDHEAIHLEQQIELLIVGFYLWYVVEWLVRLMLYCSSKRAYRNISFEREAYAYQSKPMERKRYGWFRNL